MRVFAMQTALIKQQSEAEVHSTLLSIEVN